MHLFQINISIYDVFYMFGARGFIFTKTVLYIGMLYMNQHKLCEHGMTAHTDACKTHYTVFV